MSNSFGQADIVNWFNSNMLAKRTASAGWDINRITERKGSAGPAPDPNGTCGPVANFVETEYEKKFGTGASVEGYRLMSVLWDGLVLDHVANVIAPSDYYSSPIGILGKTDCIFRLYNKQLAELTGDDFGCLEVFTKTDLMRLTVLDLYYKKTSSFEDWWKEQDNLKGEIHIGGYQRIGPDK